MPQVMIGLLMGALVMVLLSGCEKVPPDHRPLQSLTDVPLYEQGDAKRGKQIYAEACAQCHKLVAGQKKARS